MNKRHEQTFYRRQTDGNKHMKRCSRSLAIKEMQTNTTVEQHHAPIVMAEIEVVSSEA